jgi:hypothetical protein
MNYEEFLIWKFIAVVAIVAVYEFWKGLNGRK